MKRRCLVALVVGSLLACAPAAAQLPQLPEAAPPSADSVGEVVSGVVPEEVRDVVKDTPAGPVAERLAPQPAASAAGSDAAPRGNAAEAGDGSAATGRSRRRAPARSRGSRSRARDREEGGEAARGGAVPRGADSVVAVSPAAAAAEGPEDEGGLAGGLRDVIEVIPLGVWFALGGLALIGLVQTLRSGIARRREQRLRDEREELRRDVGVLESALLPPVPGRVGALAASAAHRSSGPAAGGDFYECFELEDGRAAVIVGDVSGHGREALERTRSICSTLRAYLDAGVEPRVALEMADHALPGDDSGNFATVVVGVHDSRASTLTYASAGHPAPIVTGPGAHTPVTDGSSPPLGVGVRTGLRQTSVPLGAGAAACFFTDGLLEARVNGKLLGRASLERMLAELGDSADAAALIGQVEAAADEAADDMAACLVRARDGSPPTRAVSRSSSSRALGWSRRGPRASSRRAAWSPTRSTHRSARPAWPRPRPARPCCRSRSPPPG